MVKIVSNSFATIYEKKKIVRLLKYLSNKNFILPGLVTSQGNRTASPMLATKTCGVVRNSGLTSFCKAVFSSGTSAVSSTVSP